MMGPGTGLHADETSRKIGEKRQNFAARQPFPQRHPPAAVAAVNLNNGLC
jgi:hypothetical protein